MPTASLIRAVTFSARHHYGRPDRSEEWNEARFGPQRTPHAHDYRVEVTVSGPLDPDTGFVTDLGHLDAALREVVEPLDGADLNEAVPEVREGTMQPSTEALALWLRGRLAPRVPAPARLRRIRVWESGRLAGEVEEDPGGADTAGLG